MVITATAAAQTSCIISIDELFELGISHSLQVQGSQTNVVMADENLADKNNNKYPDLNVGVSGGYIGEPSIFESGLSNLTHLDMPDWSQHYNVELIQPIYQGGRIKYSIEKAALQKNIAELNVERDISEIKLLLIGKYLDLLRLYQQQKLIETSIEQARQRLHDIRGFERNGMVTSSDVLRSELQLSTYELSLDQTKNDISIISTQLDVALGMDEEMLIVPQNDLLERSGATFSYDSCIEMAYQHYPELKIAKLYIEMAKADRQIVKADFLPKFSLKAGNTLLRPITSSSPAIDKYANNWSIDLTLSYSLSSIYHNKHKMNVARQSIILQDIQYRQMIQNIINNVKANYIKHNESLKRVETLTIS
ncbi:MAG: TolC family protein, partial [Bacteroidales bacterium]